MKVHEFERLVVKLDLKVRNTGDRHAWFEHEGKMITRTKRSHGSGFDVPGDLVRQQLKLNERQLSDLLNCTLHCDDYVSILKAKRLISPDSLVSSCLSGCFSKPPAVVYGHAAPSVSENLA